MLDWNAYRDQINAAVREMAAVNRDIVKAYAGLNQANANSTRIDAKTRELIALGVARRMHQRPHRRCDQSRRDEGRGCRCSRRCHYGERRRSDGLFGTNHRRIRHENRLTQSAGATLILQAKFFPSKRWLPRPNSTTEARTIAPNALIRARPLT